MEDSEARRELCGRVACDNGAEEGLLRKDLSELVDRDILTLLARAVSKKTGDEAKNSFLTQSLKGKDGLLM